MYKNTIQRVLLSIDSLNSNAAFLIVVHNEKKVFSWIGSNCDTSDIDNVNDLGVTVLKRDFFHNDIITIDMIREGEEKKNLLENMLDLCWSNSSSYFSKISIRSRKETITNNPVSVGIIEPSTVLNDTYDFNETNFTHPDDNGKVSRLSFVSIEMNTIAYVNIGDHWDIWIARGVTKEKEIKVIDYVKYKISLTLQLNDNNDIDIELKNLLLSQYIDVIHQGEEHTLFRRALKIFTNYEPKGGTGVVETSSSQKYNKNDYKYDSKKDDYNDNNITFNMIGNDSNKIIDNKNKNLLTTKTSQKYDTFDSSSNKKLSVNPQFNNEQVEILSTIPHNDYSINFWAFKPTSNKKDDNNYNNSSFSTDTTTIVASPVVNIPYQPIEQYNISTKSVGINESFITSNMFDMIEDLNIKPLERKKIIDLAMNDPSSLIGYQVLLLSCS